MFKQLLPAVIATLLTTVLAAQNTGIGTITPEAKLHVNGDLKLQNGFAVNKFSRDSLFAENSHNNVPTEKAIKDYVQKGSWVAPVNAAGSQAPLARGFTNQWLNGPTAVFTSGSHCFVTSYNSNELVSFNISKPDSIYNRDRDATNLDGPVDVFVQGNYAYVVNENNNRLCIFDVSNPAAMVPKAFTNVNIRVPTSVFVQGNYAYVTSDLFNNLSVYDISNPNNIVPKGFTSQNMSLPNDVFVSGNFAYLVSRGNNRLCIYDISNPDAIVPRGFTSTSLSDPRSVVVKDNYAYVTSFTNNRLCVLNVSNPDAITGNGFTNTNLLQPGGLSITGNYAFVTNTGYNSINLYDISNPASIRYIGLSQADLSGPYSVFAAGDFAYIGSYNNNRLCVFDLDKNSSIIATPGGVQTAATQWQVGNNQTIYRSNGDVGIGTSAPAAKLQVNGNTIIDGNLAIGTTEAAAPVQLAAALGEKIILYGSAYTPHYGMGVQSGLLQLFTDVSVSDIALGYGSSGSFTESMRIKGNGLVGIGTATPAKQTEIIGAASATPVTLVIGNRGGFGPAAMEFVSDYGLVNQWRPGYIRSNDIGGFTGSLEFYTNGTGAGNLYGNVKGLEVRNGQTLTATGAVGSYSDARLKENIQPFTDGLNVIKKINPVQFTYNGSAPFASTQLQTGILAQELEKVAPYMVEKTTQNGFTDLRYVNNQAYTFLLINAVKEQQLQIAQQQLQLNQQQKEIAAIKLLLQQLTQK
jgi:hypothetical protein